MKKILAFFLVIATLSGFGQSIHITGHVFAKDDGLPIPGVSVRVKGANNGVQTNTNGAYGINVPGGAILVYSYIGYTTKEITVKEKDVIDVYLEASSVTLGEVVVTEPLNYKTTPSQSGYATATVYDKNIL